VGGIARWRPPPWRGRDAAAMIQHVGEVLAVIAVAFIVGSVIGWIAYRWIDRTDFAFDQRDLADAIGRLLGIRTPAPVEEPAAAAGTGALLPVPVTPARITLAEPPAALPERTRRPESAPWPEPVAILPGDEPARSEPAARSEAAEDLRKRVQSSTRAIAWREARDERLRPGESAAQMAGVTSAPLEGEAISASVEAPRGNGRSEEKPADLTSRPRKDAAAPLDHDEPWAAPPEVWPVDLGRLPPPDVMAPLALPAPVRSEISLTLTPVAILPITADDIWSDDDDAALTEEQSPDAPPPPPPPPAADRPPALEGVDAAGDNLRRIKGIGQGFEKRLNQLGIYRYAQIAAWTERQQAWVSAELGFPGRVERDAWPAQASRLGRGGEGRAPSEPEIVRDP